MADFIDVGKEYAKDNKLKKEDVKQLQDWASKQPHLPPITERQMIFFLHSCYYSNESAKTCIETYYTARAHSPEFFTNCDLRVQRNYNDILGGLMYLPFPKLTPEGYKIVFCKLVDPNPDTFSLSAMVKSLDMTNSLLLHQEGAFKGIIFLGDFWGFSLTHMSKLNLLQMKKFFLYFQEAMPVRTITIQIINITSIVDKFLAVLKQFMNKEVFSTVRTHAKVTDEFLKVVPLDCLPKDYGGPLDSVEEIRRKWCENLLAHADFFVEEQKAVADESKRLGKRKNTVEIFGIEGSFKKLDID